MEAARRVHEIARDEPLTCRRRCHRGLSREDSGTESQLQARRRVRQTGHGNDQVEGCPHGSLRVVLVRDRGAPDGHHGVADELLDGPAVSLDDLARAGEVAGQEFAHGFRIAIFRKGGEADEIREQDGDETPFGPGAGAWLVDGAPGTSFAGGSGTRMLPASEPGGARWAPQEPQNFSSGSTAKPQTGHASAKADPHSAQKRRPALFCVPQLEQITGRPSDMAQGGSVTQADGRRSTATADAATVGCGRTQIARQ